MQPPHTSTKLRPTGADPASQCPEATPHAISAGPALSSPGSPRLPGSCVVVGRADATPGLLYWCFTSPVWGFSRPLMGQTQGLRYQ